MDFVAICQRLGDSPAVWTFIRENPGFISLIWLSTLGILSYTFVTWLEWNGKIKLAKLEAEHEFCVNCKSIIHDD